jgi:hypothetical protein
LLFVTHHVSRFTSLLTPCLPKEPEIVAALGMGNSVPKCKKFQDYNK